MTSATIPGEAVPARQIRDMVKSVTAHLAVRPRASDPVLRNTYDIEDDRARVVAPLGDGTIEDALDTRDAIMEAATEYQRRTAQQTRYSQGAITRSDLAVLRVILYDREGFDFSTGTTDLAKSQLAEKAGVNPDTVNESKKRLGKDGCGLIDWVRRSIATGLPRVFGVAQRIMTSCLTFFTIDRLCPPLARLFNDALARIRAKRARREEKTGTRGQRRPLVRRERRSPRIPALMNPRGWAAALKALAKAELARAQGAAAEEARAVAFATSWAREQHPSRE